MKKVSKYVIKSLSGDFSDEPIVTNIYYMDSGIFGCYLPPHILALIAEGKKTYVRNEKSVKLAHSKQLTGKSVDELQGSIYMAYNQFYEQNIQESKLIHYKIKFNSNKTYFNHKQSISFADTPAISFWWRIHYLITMPDGRKKVFTDHYKNFGNICSYKEVWDYEDYCKEKTHLEWSEERQKFFETTENAMEGMIAQITSFFNQPKIELESKIDGGALMLNGSNK